MAEDLEVTGKTKEEKYLSLLSQVKGLLSGETDAVANMANICGALKYGLGFFWVGFYLVNGGELVLGPFQGPVACTRIKKGRGVCGQCWEKGEAILVDDVNLFPGHIACSSASRSEIVLPLKNKSGEVTGVLDVDQDVTGAFGLTDQKYLAALLGLLGDVQG
jgi:GAF domain-containing protein